MDPMIFQFIGESVTNAMDAYVTSTVPAVIARVTATAVLLTAVYYSYVGYQMIFGRLDGSFSHLLMSAGKFVFIATFALSASFYMDTVVSGVRDLELGLSAAFSGGQETNPSSIYQVIDLTVGEGWSLAGQLWESAGNRSIREFGMMIGEYFNAIIIALSTTIIAIPAGAMIIMAKTVMELLLGIGPLFIMLLMWAPLRAFFDRWFSAIMTTVFTIALIAAVLAFALRMFSIVVNGIDINSSSDSPFFASLRVAVLTIVMMQVLYEVKGMAAGLAGGMASSAITFGNLAMNAARGLTSPARMGNAVINPQSTRRDMQSGMMVTGGRLNHLVAGNTMWNPAYRQHVSQNSRSNWGRAKGGSAKEDKSGK